jgi:hypothetical protein
MWNPGVFHSLLSGFFSRAASVFHAWSFCVLDLVCPHPCQISGEWPVLNPRHAISRLIPRRPNFHLLSRRRPVHFKIWNGWSAFFGLLPFQLVAPNGSRIASGKKSVSNSGVLTSGIRLCPSLRLIIPTPSCYTCFRIPSCLLDFGLAFGRWARALCHKAWSVELRFVSAAVTSSELASTFCQSAEILGIFAGMPPTWEGTISP